VPPAAALRELLAAAAARLAAAGVDAPRLSARLLAAHVLRLDPIDILTPSRPFAFARNPGALRGPRRPPGGRRARGLPGG